MWSLFGPFWSVKYLNFGQKLPIRTTHHTFLESRHPEVTKNQYYVLSPEWRQKKVWAHGLHLLPSIDTTDKVKFCYLTRLQYDYYEIKITFLELNTLQQYFYKCLKNLDYLSSNILIWLPYKDPPFPNNIRKFFCSLWNCYCKSQIRTECVEKFKI